MSVGLIYKLLSVLAKEAVPFVLSLLIRNGMKKYEPKTADVEAS